MRILVVEDTTTEQEAAKTAIEAAGHEVIIVRNFDEANPYFSQIDGIITDLHFNPLDREHPQYHNLKNVPPAGLLAVITALWLDIPVVICTKADGGHHGEALCWIFDGFYTHEIGSDAKAQKNGYENSRNMIKSQTDYPNECMAREYLTPFGWEDQKDWNEALTILESRIKVKEKFGK